jgi:hypothetical protein
MPSGDSAANSVLLKSIATTYLRLLNGFLFDNTYFGTIDYLFNK